MLSKKGMDGAYIGGGLLVGLIIGIVLIYFALSNGVLTDLFCPVAAVVP